MMRRKASSRVRRTNRALLAVDAAALVLGLIGAALTLTQVLRGSSPALLLLLGALVPLIVWSLRDGAFELRLLRALNRSPRP
jgi:hypothetical protein